jgi:type II secretory pathway pseudopilin PulG
MNGTNHQPRAGTTLVEVLVAILVMGIGCLAILAMFPLGAMSMARSIKDDRCAHAAANAREIAIARRIWFDSNLTTPNNYFLNATGNPNSKSHANAALDGPSYPVYVDPVGSLAYLAGKQANWVGGLVGTSALLRRRPLASISSAQLTLTNCTLLDDIYFGTNGAPANPNNLQPTVPGSVERAGKYSWAWLLRLPRAGVPNLCDVTVVVYESRNLSSGNLIATVPEFKYTASLNAAQSNVVTFNLPAGTPPPPLKEGGWILDVTQVLNNNNPAQLTANCNAKFYRVVNVGDLVTAGTGQTVDIELATNYQRGNNPSTTAATFLVLQDVVEVMELGQLWKAWNN